MFPKKHKPLYQLVIFLTLKQNSGLKPVLSRCELSSTNYPASKKNILSSVLIMKNKDKDNLPKDKTAVTTSRGHYYELLYGLSKELNSVTKQSFNHSCPVGFDAAVVQWLL